MQALGRRPRAVFAQPARVFRRFFCFLFFLEKNPILCSSPVSWASRFDSSCFFPCRVFVALFCLGVSVIFLLLFSPGFVFRGAPVDVLFFFFGRVGKAPAKVRREAVPFGGGRLSAVLGGSLGWNGKTSGACGGLGTFEAMSLPNGWGRGAEGLAGGDRSGQQNL